MIMAKEDTYTPGSDAVRSMEYYARNGGDLTQMMMGDMPGIHSTLWVDAQEEGARVGQNLMDRYFEKAGLLTPFCPEKPPIEKELLEVIQSRSFSLEQQPPLPTADKKMTDVDLSQLGSTEQAPPNFSLTPFYQGVLNELDKIKSEFGWLPEHGSRVGLNLKKKLLGLPINTVQTWVAKALNKRWAPMSFGEK
jgi:hypothetical protein